MIQGFLDYIASERHYSERTVAAYRDDLTALCAFLGWTPEEFEADMLDETDIQAWMVKMLDEDKNSPRSVKRRLSAVKSLYRYLLRKGLTKRDITARIIAPKVDKPLPVFFKPQEMASATAWDKMADDWESKRDCLIIELLYQTGMRQAELLGLRDEDVYLDEAQIRVFGKRRKERIVPIGDKLVEQIRDYQACRDEQGIGDGHLLQRRNRAGEWVGMDKNTLYTIVRTRMGEVSTLKKRSPHVLRHTFATTLLNEGADIRTIQALMGHASLQATQVYTHTTFDQLQRAYANSHPRMVQKGGKNEEK